ncbi:MAG TPA: amidohydrolase family protein [Acidobacteriota bacterium]|nr:amidohydrolase family protein [Acidobacteriota bacterium]
MKKLLVVAGATVALIAAASMPQELSEEVLEYGAVQARGVALTHVRVVDGTGAPAMEDQTILIRDGLIARIDDADSVDLGAAIEVVELDGHTVIPGLVGLHDHSYYTTSRRAVQMSFTGPRLYLAAGVTTIRTTGSEYPYAEINLKKAIEAGEVPGPRMFVTGPYLTGDQGSMTMARLSDPEHARRVVSYWAEEGVDWFKAYTWISRDELAAAIDEAHKHGIKVTAHLCSVSFREAVEAGIDNIEHGLLTNSDYDETRSPDACSRNLMQSVTELDLSSQQVKTTFREMVAAGVPMTTTPVVYEMFVKGRTELDPRAREALAPGALEEVVAGAARIEESGSIAPELFLKALQYDYMFVESGGVLAAGVDPTGYGAALPGFGDQRNFELLLETDFTPVEAIRIVSANGAKVLGIYDEVGSVEVGKQADLVVLDGNPVANPRDIRNVKLVFKGGVGYDSAKLIESVRGRVGIQ